MISDDCIISKPDEMPDEIPNENGLRNVIDLYLISLTKLSKILLALVSGSPSFTHLVIFLLEVFLCK